MRAGVEPQPVVERDQRSQHAHHRRGNPQDQPAQHRVRLLLAAREPGTGRAIKVRVNLDSEADRPELGEGALTVTGPGARSYLSLAPGLASAGGSAAAPRTSAGGPGRALALLAVGALLGSVMTGSALWAVSALRQASAPTPVTAVTPLAAETPVSSAPTTAPSR